MKKNRLAQISYKLATLFCICCSLLIFQASTTVQLYGNPEVDCRFLPDDGNCDSNQYCVTVQIKGEDGADLIGTSSIRLSYDFNVLSLDGSALGGFTTGSYTTINFDGDQTTLHPDCETLGFTPYSEQGFDALVPGDVLMTLVLTNPSVGTFTFACPSTAGIWMDVSEICFDVIDPAGDPNLQFVGVENGDPEGNASGTNFNSDTNNPLDKYWNGNFETLNMSYDELCGVVGVSGCMDPVACNYNSNATIAGSCDYGIAGCPDPCNAILGCTDATASNFDVNATCNDNSCVYIPVVTGCMDPAACNYNANATEDDNSCNYGAVGCVDPCTAVLGCTDPVAPNYDPSATCNDGSCEPNIIIPPSGGDVDVRFVANSASCSSGDYCVTVEISGDGADLIGTSSIRFSYDHQVLNFSGSSLTTVTAGTYTSINFDDDQTTLHPDCQGLGVSPYSEQGFDGSAPGDFLLTIALMSPSIGNNTFACPGINGEWIPVSEICFEVLNPVGNPNFQVSGIENGDSAGDETGTNFGTDTNDGSKYLNGDFQSLSTSYNALCGGSTVVGCTDVTACNYNAAATVNDGSCIYPATNCACGDVVGCIDPVALNYNPTATCQGTVVCEYENPPIPGCTDPAACNYNPQSTIDGPCTYPVANCACDDIAGCTDPAALNYDPTATCGTETCVYGTSPGCTDPVACNYDPTATVNDGFCVYPVANCACGDVAGCTDPTALNYNSQATCGIDVCEYGPNPEGGLPVLFINNPWLISVVDPTDCTDETVVVYQSGSFNYFYIDGVLYFQDGTFYCADSPGYSCVSLYSLSAVVESWTCGQTAPNPGQNPIFNDFSWLSSIVNPANCTNETVTVYQSGSFQYVYVNGSLYFQDGTFYCADSPGYSCVSLYGLSTVANSWTCGETTPNPTPDPIFTDYPWLTSLVNLSDCGNTTATVYQSGIFNYIYVNGNLYFEDGTFYCADSPGYSCVSLYGLSTVVDSWTCGNNPQPPTTGLFTTYTWLNSLVNPTTCDGEVINVYSSGGYEYIHVIQANGLGALYFENGTFYCQDLANYSCMAAYGFGAPVETWSCALGLDRPAEETCTDALKPVNICFEALESDYIIDDVIQMREEGSIQILNNQCFRYTPLANTTEQQELSVMVCNQSGNCKQIPYKVNIGNCNIPELDENVRNAEARLTDLEEQMAFKMYPNPSTGSVFLNLEKGAEMEQTITVFDLAGNPILETQLPANSDKTTVELNLNDLPTGFYLVELKTAFQSDVQRLVIE